MKKLKIGIASYEEMKKRSIAIARGDYKPSKNDPKIWFTSTRSFAQVLSDQNRALLDEIAHNSPESLSELSGRTGRHKSNLSRSLKTMERYGLVKLERQVDGKIIPRVPYKEISLTFSI